MREYKFRMMFNGRWEYFGIPFNEQLFLGDDGWDIKTFGQYIGFHDRQGEEIYEGDIVENKHAVRWIVFWSDKKNGYKLKALEGATEFSFTDQEYWRGRYKVIGNIYEQPKLAQRSE